MGYFELPDLDIDSITNQELIDLGKSYFNENPRLGLACIYHAYLRHDAKAAYEVSLCYYNGIGTDSSVMEGSFYEEEAARMGYVIAQRKIANRLITFKDDVSLKLAMYWLRKAADQEDIEDIYNYGLFCLEYGYKLEAKKFLNKIIDYKDVKIRLKELE